MKHMKICPICHGDFQMRNVSGKSGTVELDCCEGCGSVWFDNQELRNTTRIEDVIRHSSQLDYKNAKACPRCAGLLKPNHKSTTTHNISEYKCPDCQGELVVGVTMHKRAARQMGVLFIALGLGLVGLFSYLTVNLTTSIQIQASALVSSPIVTQLSPSSISITFTTTTPQLAKLILSASYLSSERKIVVSSSPQTIHQLTVEGLILNQEHNYRLILIDEEGVEKLSPTYLYVKGREI